MSPTSEASGTLPTVSASDVATAADVLTQTWATALDPKRNTVISGAGAWALLVGLLHGASGPARAELSEAMSVDPAVAAPMLHGAMTVVGRAAGCRLAVGVWTRPDVSIREAYRTALPEVTVAPMPSDRAELDRWAAQGTDGLISRFPGPVDASTLLVAASALVAQGSWQAPFDPGGYRWHGEQRWEGGLHRTTTELDDAALVAAGPLVISRLRCRTAGFDVHVVAGGETATPSQVLRAAIAEVHGEAVVRPGSSLQDGEAGGCLRVTVVDDADDTPLLRTSLPAFDVESEHDLLANAALFGLTCAVDASVGHFDGLSPTPLAVQAAVQSARASFSAEGFRAAAVTMVAMRAGSAMRTEAARRRVVSLQHDRPFGFLVVERSAGLVLFAGWIAEPGTTATPAPLGGVPPR